MTNDTVVFATDTDFGHYEVLDTVYGGRPARVLYSGHRQAAQSGVAQDGKPELLFDYNERFMELIRGLRPRRILLLGGGACTLPQAIVQEFPGTELDIVELDGALLDIARKYFDFAPSKQVAMHVDGGAAYLARTNKTYDMILLDVFANATVPPTFQTDEVTQHLAHALREGGIVAMNIIAGYYGERAAVLRRQVAAFQSTFSNVQLFPAGHEPSLWLPQNFILTCQNGQRNLQPLLRYSSLALPRST